MFPFSLLNFQASISFGGDSVDFMLLVFTQVEQENKEENRECR